MAIEAKEKRTEVYADVEWFRRVRYLMTFLITFVIAASFMMRTALSIGIVAMTDNTTNADFETFEWDSATQGTVLSSFFWGYVVTNIPMGMMVIKYGPRWILFGSIIICTLATYLTPIAASSGGWQTLCALRVIQGATQGSVFPSMSALLAKWAPAHERGRLQAIAYSGIQAGNIISLPVGGALSSSVAGWPSVFYIFGSVGVIWCILWLIFGFNSPADHPRVSDLEKKYIQSFYQNQPVTASLYTPWLSIVTSLPMWAVLIAHCVQNWGFYMLLTEMPTYMNDILEYNISDNGVLTALPYVVMFVLIHVCSFCADQLLSRNIIYITTQRKIFNAIGFLCPMATMIGLTYVGHEQKEIAVMLLILSAGLNSGVYVGFQVNHIDLSPNFAGTLMGITNGIGNCVSLVVPITVGAIVTEKKNEEQWHIVFWITAGIYLIGTAFYSLFGQAQIQPWNDKTRSKAKT